MTENNKNKRINTEWAWCPNCWDRFFHILDKMRWVCPKCLLPNVIVEEVRSVTWDEFLDYIRKEIGNYASDEYWKVKFNLLKGKSREEISKEIPFLVVNAIGMDFGDKMFDPDRAGDLFKRVIKIPDKPSTITYYHDVPENLIDSISNVNSEVERYKLYYGYFRKFIDVNEFSDEILNQLNRSIIEEFERRLKKMSDKLILNGHDLEEINIDVDQVPSGDLFDYLKQFSSDSEAIDRVLAALNGESNNEKNEGNSQLSTSKTN